MEMIVAKILTVCECIDQCFTYEVWCRDFASFVVQDDMIWGQGNSFDLISKATLLKSFLALRKISDFLGEGGVARTDDITTLSMGIDLGKIERVSGEFLNYDERVSINKSVAHLTERLSLEPDSEVDLHRIVIRSMPTFRSLVSQMSELTKDVSALRVLERTKLLLNRME